MDDHFSEDLLNFKIDEEMFQRLVNEVVNDMDRELNVELYDDESDELSVEFLQPTIGSLYKTITNEQDDFMSSAITNQWSHTASCSSDMATGITHLGPPNQEPDEADEYPLESLQPTIGSLYKATVNEQEDFASCTITNHWSHTASCSNGIATGTTNLVPPNQEFDENDEYPLKILQPTIGSLYKATTNKQDGFTSSTRTNHWSHTASCSGDMVTGITNLVPPNQLPVNSGTLQLKPEPILQNQQHRISHNMQSPALIPPTQCPGITQSHVSPQTQDHSKTCLTYRMSPNPQCRTDHAASTQLERVPSSEALACTDTASAAYQQHTQRLSHHQQLRSELGIPSFLHPLPHTPMPMQNPQPRMIPQESKPPSGKSVVHQPTESSPVQMINYRKMQDFARNFTTGSIILGLTLKEISSVFYKLSGIEILQIWIVQLKKFRVFIHNMRQMKFLLEIWLDRICNSRTTTHSLRNSQMDSHLASDRPDSTTGEETNNRISQGGGSVSKNNLNHVGNDVEKSEDHAELRNSTVPSHCNATSNKNVVSSSSATKIHVGNFDICLYHKDTCVSNLHSCKLCLVVEPVGHNLERLSLEALQNFVNTFIKRRKELGFAQDDISLKLGEMCGRQFKGLCINQFEEFNVFYKEICKAKPQIEQWFENRHISQIDVRKIKDYQPLLAQVFEWNHNPAANVIDCIAKKTNFHRDVLTFWFDKRRQIHEWNNTPTA